MTAQRVLNSKYSNLFPNTALYVERGGGGGKALIDSQFNIYNFPALHSMKIFLLKLNSFLNIILVLISCNTLNYELVQIRPKIEFHFLCTYLLLIA